MYLTIVGACIGDAGLIPPQLRGANLTENAAKLCNFSANIVNIYLSFWLNSPVAQQMIKDNILSATLGKLSLERIRKLSVPLPPVAEQHEIVRQLESLLGHETDAAGLLDMDDELDLLEQSILSRAFRGELGTNDPAESPML